MKALQTSFALILASTFAVAAAHAQSPLTREQVKAEYDDAVRNGDILGPGDSGMKLNEMYPNRYPKAVVTGKTRAQVIAEHEAAVRSGDIVIDGETGVKEDERYPQRYPALPGVAGKTRAQVRAEYEEAVRTGDILAPGDVGLKLNEEFPQRYAKVRAGNSVRGELATATPASAAGGTVQ